jgi:uncharacterized protein with PIN domain
MIAYLRDEPGAEVVAGFLLDKDNLCMAHAINMCEVYYNFVRLEGEDSASSVIQDLKADGLAIREDLDETFWREIGKHKAAIGSVPLADCFAVALANRYGARVATADWPDFEPMQQQGICQVTFIRPKRQTPGQAS